MKTQPILYIKPGCPWCREARSFFDQNGIAIEIRDVTKSKAAMQRMIQISGQTLTPTFEYGEFVVADFSVNELNEELDQFPELRAELGLGSEDE